MVKDLLSATKGHREVVQLVGIEPPPVRPKPRSRDKEVEQGGLLTCGASEQEPTGCRTGQGGLAHRTGERRRKDRVESIASRDQRFSAGPRRESVACGHRSARHYAAAGDPSGSSS